MKKCKHHKNCKSYPTKCSQCRGSAKFIINDFFNTKNMSFKNEKNKGKSDMTPEIEEIHILGYVTKVIDADKREYEMLFKPNIFGNVKNMEDMK